MTTVPLPSFLPTDALDDFQEIRRTSHLPCFAVGAYGSARYGKSDSKALINYCGYLIRQRMLVFSPLVFGRFAR